MKMSVVDLFRFEFRFVFLRLLLGDSGIDIFFFLRNTYKENKLYIKLYLNYRIKDGCDLCKLLKLKVLSFFYLENNSVFFIR